MMLIDVTSAFKGFTAPIRELYDDIHRRGWTIKKVDIKDGQYLAVGSNPHGETLEATGINEATALGNLLVRVMRREYMRASAIKERLGAWDPYPLEQMYSAIAQAYASASVYDPKAAVAWMDLAQDFQRRAQIIKEQVSIEYTNDPIPYASADELRDDVTKKRHITLTRAYSHHPIWSEAQMLDYRLVVDVLGHTIGGGDWGWHGSCLAFSQLAPLLAEEPQKALFTELLGQAAFGQFYRQWGPQKIAFLNDLIEKEQEKENKPGHYPVHPSQSIVPTQAPRINTPGTFSAVIGVPKDPNEDWSSEVTPLPDNGYLWQRDNGVDPLDVENVRAAIQPLEAGLSNMHPQMVQQSVANALRMALLGARQSPRAHAIHYQSLYNLPAAVDDPIAYQDALEQARDHWNIGQGYAPGSHKQHFAQEAQFKQWVKAANPHLDDGEVNRLAKREMLHMLSEEEERVLAVDQGEQMTAEQIEHEAFEGLRNRLKVLTKPNVDQKVDFGDTHLYHEATHHADMYPPYLASRMRALAQIGRNSSALAEAAREDLLSHKGHGHHFRSTALSLGIPGLGPRQISNAWLHLAPQTSQLAPIDPYLSEVLGHNYEDASNRDFFKHERELAAGRDAAGYGHIPLGTFATGLWDLRAGGPGWHPNRSPLKAYSPTPHHTVDWTTQIPQDAGWQAPYWWDSTQEARDQAGQEFDRSIGTNTPRDEIPFKTASNIDPAYLAQIREQGRAQTLQDTPMSDTDIAQSPGFGCHYIAPLVQDAYPEALHRSGIRIFPDGNYADHHWNQLPDGTIIDATYNHSLPPGHPDQHNYVEYGELGEDADPEENPEGFQTWLSQRTATRLGSSYTSPWVTDPRTGQRLTGPPGTSLMQHLKGVFGHPSVTDVWNHPEYEVGKYDIEMLRDDD